MSDVALAYETLDRQSQIEVEQLVSRLVLKQERLRPEKKRSREEIDAMLKSLMGKSHSWNGADVLDYQRKLRGEYRDNV